MEEILHQLIGSLYHYFQGFIHPRRCRISSINSMIHQHPSTTQQYSPRVPKWRPFLLNPRMIRWVHVEGFQYSTCLHGLSPSLRLHLVLSGCWLVARCADQLIIIHSEKSRIRLALLDSQHPGVILCMQWWHSWSLLPSNRIFLGLALVHTARTTWIGKELWWFRHWDIQQESWKRWLLHSNWEQKFHPKVY